MKIFSRNMKFLSQIENIKIKIKIKNLLDEFNYRLEIAEEIIWWRHDNKVSKLMPIKEKRMIGKIIKENIGFIENI